MQDTLPAVFSPSSPIHTSHMLDKSELFPALGKKIQDRQGTNNENTRTGQFSDLTKANSSDCLTKMPSALTESAVAHNVS